MSRSFEDKFYFENSQYFAIAYAKLFNCKVCLWLDTDYYARDPKKSVRLCHAFVQIVPGLYADAAGGFTQLSCRYHDFEYNEVNIKVCNTLDEAKQILRKLDVPYTDSQTKHEVLEFLSNNVLCFEYDYNKLTNTHNIYKRGGAVITGEDTMEPDTMFFREYSQDKRMLIRCKRHIQQRQFIRMLTGNDAFVPAPNWRRHT